MKCCCCGAENAQYIRTFFKMHRAASVNAMLRTKTVSASVGDITTLAVCKDCLNAAKRKRVIGYAVASALSLALAGFLVAVARFEEAGNIVIFLMVAACAVGFVCALLRSLGEGARKRMAGMYILQKHLRGVWMNAADDCDFFVEMSGITQKMSESSFLSRHQFKTTAGKKLYTALLKTGAWQKVEELAVRADAAGVGAGGAGAGNAGANAPRPAPAQSPLPNNAMKEFSA